MDSDDEITRALQKKQRAALLSNAARLGSFLPPEPCAGRHEPLANG